MNKRPILIIWPNNTTSTFESIKDTAKELNVTVLTIRNYLKYQNAPMRIKFQYNDNNQTGYERLLRHVMKKFGRPRKIKLTLEENT